MRTTLRATATATAAVLALAGCGSTIGGAGAAPSAAGTTARGGTVTVAVTESWDAYNPSTVAGGRGANIAVSQLVQSAFWTYDADGGVVRNEDLGTYEKVSDDPLTVEYTIHPDAVWSDGTPIDYDDVLLAWATSARAVVDEDGEPLFDTYGTVAGDLQQEPVGEPGDKTFTVVYTEPTSEWEQGVAGVLPAHVVAAQAGLEPDDLVAALRAADLDVLAPAAEFWNTGWQVGPDAPLPDAALVPSSGPFVLSSRDAGSLVLKRNEAYWGASPAIDTLVLRTLDPAEHVAALLNGDVDVISPQPDADVHGRLTAADGVTTIAGDAYVYDHVDFNFGSPVFSSHDARAAFALCLPRQQIVENLYAIVNPDAEVAQLREVFPFQPAYRSTLADVPSADRYAATDVAAARALLDASGTTDRSVTLLTSASNARYVDAARMIEASCEEAGFDVTLDLDASWSEKLGGDGWDAVLFQWNGTGSPTETEPIYVTDGMLNFGGYTDAEVDRLWEQIRTTTDLEAVATLRTRLEERLWSTLFSVPLAVQPRLTAASDRVRGVVHNTTSTGVTFNAATWSIAG